VLIAQLLQQQRAEAGARAAAQRMRHDGAGAPVAPFPLPPQHLERRVGDPAAGTLAAAVVAHRPVVAAPALLDEGTPWVEALLAERAHHSADDLRLGVDQDAATAPALVEKPALRRLL
jgi:hypothetical protein